MAGLYSSWQLGRPGNGLAGEQGRLGNGLGPAGLGSPPGPESRGHTHSVAVGVAHDVRKFAMTFKRYRMLMATICLELEDVRTWSQPQGRVPPYRSWDGGTSMGGGTGRGGASGRGGGTCTPLVRSY